MPQGESNFKGKHMPTRYLPTYKQITRNFPTPYKVDGYQPQPGNYVYDDSRLSLPELHKKATKNGVFSGPMQKLHAVLEKAYQQGWDDRLEDLSEDAKWRGPRTFEDFARIAADRDLPKAISTLLADPNSIKPMKFAMLFQDVYNTLLQHSHPQYASARVAKVGITAFPKKKVRHELYAEIFGADNQASAEAEEQAVFDAEEQGAYDVTNEVIAFWSADQDRQLRIYRMLLIKRYLVDAGIPTGQATAAHKLFSSMLGENVASVKSRRYLIEV
jgi:hypothetical protein